MKYRKINGYKYELLSGYVHEGIAIPGFAQNDYITLDNGTLLINARYAWDGPSGPTIDTKDFMRGSLVHDALYQLIREGLIESKYRKYADELLKDICLQDGMPSWRAWYVYTCVRLFADGAAKKDAHIKSEAIEI